MYYDYRRLGGDVRQDPPIGKSLFAFAFALLACTHARKIRMLGGSIAPNESPVGGGGGPTGSVLCVFSRFFDMDFFSLGWLKLC